MYEAVVIGAGPAGFASSRELSARGVSHVVLERGDQIGQMWAHLYDSLVLHTARALSTLPGLSYPRGTPLFPTRHHFLAYLQRYADAFQVPVQTRTEVLRLQPVNGGWIARTATGCDLQARSVVIATGIVSNPVVPQIPGRHLFQGPVFHSVDYRRPAALTGQRVLVVGAGNSAGEISVELARAGAKVTLAVRTGASVVPREIAGIPIQYLALGAATLPRSVQRQITAVIARTSALLRGPSPLPPPIPTACSRVPLIGLHVADALRSGAIALAGGVAEFTSDGVRFEDGTRRAFDAVILATGFRAALAMLDGVIRRDRCGFALRNDRVASADHSSLYFVGQTYDLRGALFNIRRDAKRASALLTKAIGGTSRTSTGTPPRESER